MPVVELTAEVISEHLIIGWASVEHIYLNRTYHIDEQTTGYVYLIKVWFTLLGHLTVSTKDRFLLTVNIHTFCWLD